MSIQTSVQEDTKQRWAIVDLCYQKATARGDLVNTYPMLSEKEYRAYVKMAQLFTPESRAFGLSFSYYWQMRNSDFFPANDMIKQSDNNKWSVDDLIKNMGPVVPCPYVKLEKLRCILPHRTSYADVIEMNGVKLLRHCQGNFDRAFLLFAASKLL